MIALTVRLVVSLAVVVGLLLLTARLGSRRFRSSTGAPVRVVHRQALSRSSSIAVVEVGARTLLLGTTEHQVNLLTDLTGDLPRETATPATPTTTGEVVAAEELPVVEQASFGPHLAAALASRASRATRTSSRLRLADEGAPDTTVVTPEGVSVDTTADSPVVPVASLEGLDEPAARPAGAHRRPGSHAGKRRAAPAARGTRAARAGRASRVDEPGAPAATAAQPQGALAGSILSVQTWRQAAAVARGRAQ